MPEPRVWVVGMANPYQSDPEDAQHFAMYPAPPESAGGRFCDLILGMQQRDYLRAFERRDLCHPKWSDPLARASAACLTWEMGAGDVVFLLGRKPWEAFFPDKHDPPWSLFNHAQRIFWSDGRRVHLDFVALPHPSGLNTAVWGNYLSYSRVRAAVAEAAPHLAPLLGRSELTRGRTAAEREVARAG